MPSNPFIIVPCFNESSEVIRKSVAALLPLGIPVVIVDDGSVPSAQDAVSDLPVHFLRHPVNLGQGAALQTGMLYCRRLGADAVIHFDADGQHDPADIPAFLKALDSCDAALGSRFLRKQDCLMVPPLRRLLLKAARIVSFCFTGVWLTDAHNGFRALGPKALKAVNLTENKMAHATEIIAQLKHAHLKITEIPVSISYSVYTTKKGQKWFNSLNIIIDLIMEKFL